MIPRLYKQRCCKAGIIESQSDIMIPAIIQNSDRNHGGTYMKKLNVGILGFGTVGGGA